jgi:hypothetical protein
MWHNLGQAAARCVSRHRTCLRPRRPHSRRRTLRGRANSSRMSRFVRSLPAGLKCSYAVVFAALLLTLARTGWHQLTPDL